MPEPGRVDRSVLTVADSFEEADAADRAFWWAQTPEKHLQTIQYLREVNYGDAAPARLQRVLAFGVRAPDGRYRRTDGPFDLNAS